MKLPTILTTAALMAGFVPLGKAICYPGQIALGHDGRSDRVGSIFQPENSCVITFGTISHGGSTRMIAAKSRNTLTVTLVVVGITVMPK